MFVRQCRHYSLQSTVYSQSASLCWQAVRVENLPIVADCQPGGKSVSVC